MSTALATREQSLPSEEQPRRPARRDSFSLPTILPRDPRRDLALTAAVAHVEGLLLDEFARSDASFAAWPSDESIAARTGLTIRQIRYGLARLSELGRVLRFRSLRRFMAWIETEGAPVYGVGRPKAMGRPSRVLVFVRRLPPVQRDPAKLWPLGLDGVVVEQKCHSELTTLSIPNSQDCPLLSYSNIRKGNEKVNESIATRFASEIQSPAVEPTPKPDTIPMAARKPPQNASELRHVELKSLFDSLPQTQRDGLLAAAKAQCPSLAKMTSLIEGMALAALELAHPDLFPTLTEPSPSFQPRLAAVPARKATVAEIATARIVEAATTKNPDAYEAAAQCIASALGDRGAINFHRKVMAKMASLELKPSDVVKAFKSAQSSSSSTKGRLYNSSISSLQR